MDARVDLRLLRGPEDADPRSPALQAELSAFGAGLREAGVPFSERGKAFESVEVLGYPLPQFILAVSPIAVAAIDGIVALAKTWIENRPARGITFEDGKTFVKVERVEDLPALKSFLESRNDP